MNNQSFDILVVDDQPNWRDALFTILTEAGYSVGVADSFGIAKKELYTYSYSLVILDVRMVDQDIFNVDGLDLLRFIKNNFPNVRTMLLTGYPDSVPDKTEADAFIHKVPPGATFDKKKFITAINSIIDSSEKSRE